MPAERIGLSEFAARRKNLRAGLKGAVGLVFAGEHDAHLDTAFRPHPHFEYLTGVTDEPGAVLLLDPANPVEDRRDLLFLRPLNREVEKWDGYRLEVGETLRKKTGLKGIFRLVTMPRLLNDAALRAKKLACLHPLACYTQAVSPDLAIFRKLAERIPGLVIEDHTARPARMRSVKSSNEIALIQRAIDITATGFETMMGSMQAGRNEFDVQETIEHSYRTSGARDLAFGTIAGSGRNSTVLHYRANDQTLTDGDLVCVDSGASFGGYCADITRTVPVNGRFSDRQREIYEIVLRAELAAIKAAKPGATFAGLDKVARAVITKAGFGDAFVHSIGHHLGLETHDINPDEPLREGAVITIEPGVYLPDEKIGVRIEDDVLITKTGAKNLSAKIPKTVGEVEGAMKGKGRFKD